MAQLLDQTAAILAAAGVRRVVIHAGRLKTGSTFLQSLLLRNREALLRHGILYPNSMLSPEVDFGAGRGLRTSGHMGLVRMAQGLPVERGMTGRLAAELEETRPEIVLLSAENLTRVPQQQLCATVSKRMAALDLTFLVYCRNPATWIESLHREDVTGSHHREARALEQAIAESLRDYSDLVGLAKSLDAGPSSHRLEIASYDAARSGPGGLAADFLRRIGAGEIIDTADAGARSLVANLSPNRTVAELFRIFNALTVGVHTPGYKAAHKMLVERLTPINGRDPWPLLSSARQAEINREWAGRNRVLVERGLFDANAMAELCETEPEDPDWTPLDTLRRDDLEIVFGLIRELEINGFPSAPQTMALGRLFLGRFARGLGRAADPRRLTSWRR